MRENREKFVWSVSLCSYYSCCSRFMVLNRSVRSNFHREMHENLRKFVWSASPCSYRSRCSRFMFLKRSVRCNFHREAREKREQKRECPQEDLTAKCAKIGNKNGVSLGSLSSTLRKFCRKGFLLAHPALNPWATGGFPSLSHPTPRGCTKPAKACMVYLSLFVLFALFAVHVSKRECPL